MAMPMATARVSYPGRIDTQKRPVPSRVYQHVTLSNTRCTPHAPHARAHAP